MSVWGWLFVQLMGRHSHRHGKTKKSDPTVRRLLPLPLLQHRRVFQAVFIVRLLTLAFSLPPHYCMIPTRPNASCRPRIRPCHGGDSGPGELEVTVAPIPHPMPSIVFLLLLPGPSPGIVFLRKVDAVRLWFLVFWDQSIGQLILFLPAFSQQLRPLARNPLSSLLWRAGYIPSVQGAQLPVHSGLRHDGLLRTSSRT